MTLQEWTDEVSRRIRGYEGLRLYKYLDSRGVPTLGYGYNLNNGLAVWTHVGADPAKIQDAPTAKTSDIEDAVAECVTQAQCLAVFDAILPSYVQDARESLPSGVFDALDDARRFCIVSLTYQMGDGADGWGGFGETHALIARAVAQKNAGHFPEASALFGEAADHLAASAWYGQSGQRAIDIVAMMRTSEWTPPLVPA